MWWFALFLMALSAACIVWSRAHWVAVALFVFFAVMVFKPAFGHDHGRTDPNWEKLTPEQKLWMKTLMRPDNPAMSCCGESDQYFCEAFVKDGETYCRITDDRPDEEFGRMHRDIGAVYKIPNEKLKHDRGNPFGSAILFIGVNDAIYCFVQGTLS